MIKFRSACLDAVRGVNAVSIRRSWTYRSANRRIDEPTDARCDDGREPDAAVDTPCPPRRHGGLARPDPVTPMRHGSARDRCVVRRAHPTIAWGGVNGVSTFARRSAISGGPGMPPRDSAGPRPPTEEWIAPARPSKRLGTGHPERRPAPKRDPGKRRFHSPTLCGCGPA